MHVVDEASPLHRARALDLGPHLRTRALARTVEVHPSLPSTNARALELARAGAEAGLAVVGIEQTAGRGQRGRDWYSPPGAGLYVSFLLRPTLPPRLVSALTLVAGVVVREAIADAFGVAGRLRWPNDLLAAPSAGGAPKKLAGILLEAAADQTRVEHAVLGIGLNLASVALPEALEPAATSLQALTGTTPGLAEALGAIANHLEPALDEVQADGLAPAAARWTKYALGLGQTVELDDGTRMVRGTLLGIAEDGALRIQTPSGPQDLYRGTLTVPGVPKTPRAF